MIALSQPPDWTVYVNNRRDHTRRHACTYTEPWKAILKHANVSFYIATSESSGYASSRFSSFFLSLREVPQFSEALTRCPFLHYAVYADLRGQSILLVTIIRSNKGRQDEVDTQRRHRENKYDVMRPPSK